MGIKILLVDDSATMLRILKTSAQMVIADVEILEARNGQEAFECLEKNTDISLILLDVNMPVMNGIEFLWKMREDGRFPNVKVIMQTTETGKLTVEKAMELGISGYLMKPYQTKRVQELMTQLAPVIGYELKK